MLGCVVPYSRCHSWSYTPLTMHCIIQCLKLLFSGSHLLKISFCVNTLSPYSSRQRLWASRSRRLVVCPCNLLFVLVRLCNLAHLGSTFQNFDKTIRHSIHCGMAVFCCKLVMGRSSKWQDVIRNNIRSVFITGYLYSIARCIYRQRRLQRVTTLLDVPAFYSSRLVV